MENYQTMIFMILSFLLPENQLYEALTELKNNRSNTIVTMIDSLDSSIMQHCRKGELRLFQEQAEV